PEISPKTIQRVKELAELHNYRPNPTAVNLKRKTTGNIAVIVPNISNTFFAQVMEGIEIEARERGFQVITYISNESLHLEQQITELLSNGIVDGLLISVSEETQKNKDYDHIHRLVEYEIPVVLFDRINMEIDLDKVGVNDMVSIYDAVHFLYSKSLKKIGLVCGLGDIGIGKERIEGYEKASEELSLPVNKDYLIVSQNPTTLRNRLRKLLKEHKVEALIGLDYLSTLLISRIVQESGFSIPGDIKVIGFVNEDFAAYLWPSLSYIDQHPNNIGKISTKQLVNRIKHPQSGETQETILKTEFVHLDSTKF
ncbi:MAG: LacI family DNA-binding transcriptional regulator, partial [Gillisia sp.]